MNVSQIWAELDAEAAAEGRFRRRIHQESVADLYLVVEKPSNTRALLIDVDLSGVELGELPSGRGVDLCRVPATANGQALELVLSKPSFADLFDTLVIDVAKAAAAGVDKADVAARVTERVRRWQRFLRGSSAGLTPERQRGLFGELFFLRTILLGAVPAFTAVQAWVGPHGRPQDFSFGDAAVEVKTTIGAQPQLLRIASERQLDTTALKNLALYQLSLDAREGAGQTLPDMIAEIRKRLQDPMATAMFEDRLFDAGYLDAQAGLYRDGYTVRAAGIFLIGDGFPRLVEADCPHGVGDVEYSISVSALGPFMVDASALVPIIREATGA
ncbi:PD-(D/E)XK motif protein [Mycolicibacterium lacusdiani]|uniref:PD-(D/E)XK motif protein n=1 Tax=Mycolicibacterium lacusdiani TaxID=2895283 RepID=UPI001F26F750|nr:PD-(D/E)XK motif protein [Mycolicibacterium lacusdiani]